MADETYTGHDGSGSLEDTPWDLSLLEQQRAGKLAERLKFADAAQKMAEYIVQVAPQKDQNGRVNYCFSGSLAASLLSQVESFTEIVVIPDGSIIETGGGSVSVSPGAQEQLLGFNRMLGSDIDVAVMRAGPYQVARSFGNTPPSSNNILDNVPEARYLCEWASDVSRGDKFDDVSDRAIDKGNQHVAIAKMKDGQEILITSPAYILGYKVYEYALASNNPEIKLKPNVETDIANLIRGLKEVYSNEVIRGAILDAFRERISEKNDQIRETILARVEGIMDQYGL